MDDWTDEFCDDVVIVVVPVLFEVVLVLVVDSSNATDASATASTTKTTRSAFLGFNFGCFHSRRLPLKFGVPSSRCSGGGAMNPIHGVSCIKLPPESSSDFVH